MEEEIKRILSKANIEDRKDLTKQLGEMLVDAEYNKKMARSPKGKRRAKATLDFFASIYTYLKE